MNSKFNRVNDDFWVAGQLTLQDIADAAADGFTLVINNRPDGEVPGQPSSAEIEAAVKKAGLTYAFIPVSGGLSPEQLDAFDATVSKSGGKTLAFCRSGMRSTVLRSYAAARAGLSPATLVGEAQAAGYDISGHAPALTALASAAT
jgi:uncharacterized protein (TIGR01244 family)